MLQLLPKQKIYLSGLYLIVHILEIILGVLGLVDFNLMEVLNLMVIGSGLLVKHLATLIGMLANRVTVGETVRVL